MKRLLLSAIALLSIQFLRAQESVDTISSVYDFDYPITVTATAARAETPVTFVNLDREDIAVRNLGQDAPYLLKWTPSVVVNSDAGTGIGYTGIWIRGSDPTRTNITINGIPYNDSESQGVYWVNLPDFSSSADMIQIQRGVGTSTNGAGAFGASINFTTVGEESDPGIHLDGGVGSFGTRRGVVRYRGTTDNGYTIDARYSKIHSDGYIDRASADLDGYYAAVSKKVGNGLISLVAFGGHEVTYQSWNGVTQTEIDTFGRTFNSVGTEKAGDPYDNEVDNYRQNHYQLHYNSKLTDALDLTLSGHYTRGLGYFEQYKANETLADYGIEAEVDESDLIRRRWLDNHFYGTVYSLRYRQDRWDLTFGGSANEYLGGHYGEVIWARYAGDSEIRDRYYDNDATKRDFSNYLRANYRLVDEVSVYLDGQVRHVQYDFIGLDERLNQLEQDASHTFFNPKAGLVYLPATGTRLYASFGVAQREPNRNDFVDNPVSTRPVAEKLYNTEIGFSRMLSRANYGINLYYMDYRDQLVLTGALNDVGEYIRTNVPESYRLGVELQGGVQVVPNLTVGGNLTLSRNRVNSFTELLDDWNEGGQVEVVREDTPLSFSPDVTGALEVAYDRKFQQHRIGAALQTKYVGDRYVDNSGADQSKLDGYYYSDLRLSYGLNDRYRLTFMLRNLTNQLYSSNGWSYRYQLDGAANTMLGMYPQAGRNFMLSLGIDL
ncbi:iron complex outermembrane receptor protein [Neolewinella xylanilytica]|uniref:Iron complex outermembrane receptor protein n=1 Tax=Neolewinella xylanilytica TaxID=1514080 RepID=A0A2S6IAP4_9BACT|nr:TonB-dependent receptor [Neolewinella xylanilytica]PPK88555.1 iron complex outermembrane receptor protein [Neolewinella xylanilytica]